MLYLKKLTAASSAIAYKNRFIISKSSASERFTGLFINKGNKILVLKQINYVYLSFLRAYHGLTVDSALSDRFDFSNKDLSEFSKLYDTYLLFRDFKRALLWRITDNLPIVKTVSTLAREKKTKKKKNSKAYNVEYRYITELQRTQIAIRWLSLLSKIEDDKLSNGMAVVISEFIVTPGTSKYEILKKRVYSGLLETK